MSRLSLGLFLAMAVTSTPLAWAQDGSVSRKIGRRLAVVVGVENYDKSAALKDLEYPVEDARGLAEVLKARGYESRDVRILLGTRDPAEVVPVADRADRAKIDEAVNDAIARCQGPNDAMIVAFSGHGLQLVDRRGPEPAYRSFFCPTDANPADPASMVDLASLYERLKACKAGMKLLLVDACQSEDPGARSKVFNGPSSTRPDFHLRPRNTAAFFACEVGGQSFEVADLGHGIFMHCVIKAFQGEVKAALDEASGDVTFESLQRYLAAEVPELCKRYQKPAQSPTVSYHDANGRAVVVRLEGYQDSLKRLEFHRARHEPDKAWSKAQEAVGRGPDVFVTWLRSAEVGLEVGASRAMVIDHATRAIEILESDPESHSIERASAYLLRARARDLDDRGRRARTPEGFDPALKDLEECLNALARPSLEHPDEVKKPRRDALLLRAELALEKGDVALAARTFDDLSRSLLRSDFFAGRPESSFDYLLLKARLRAAEGKYDEALKLTEDLPSLVKPLRDPSGRARSIYLAQGRIYRGLGQFDEAAGCLKIALLADPRSDETRQLLGDVLVEARKFTEARDLFARVIDRSPSPEAVLGMARAQIGLNRFAEAAESLDTALDRPDVAPRVRSRMLVARAKARLGGGPDASRKALEDCVAALGIDPGSKEALQVRDEARAKSIEAGAIIMPTSGPKADDGRDRPDQS